jgi:hypothetical protein
MSYGDIGQIHVWKEFFKDVQLYAFPNGSYRPEQIEQVLNFGYKKALLVNEETCALNASSWTRFTFYGNSHAEIRFRSTGGLSKI